MCVESVQEDHISGLSCLTSKGNQVQRMLFLLYGIGLVWYGPPVCLLYMHSIEKLALGDVQRIAQRQKKKVDYHTAVWFNNFIDTPQLGN
jgi:hypothetical protein